MSDPSTYSSIKDILVILTGSFTLIAGAVVALWAYTKYVLERGLLPPVQFDVDCTDIVVSEGKRILEFLIHLKNVGTATLVARNIRLDIRYKGTSKNPCPQA